MAIIIKTKNAVERCLKNASLRIAKVANLCLINMPKSTGIKVIKIRPIVVLSRENDSPGESLNCSMAKRMINGVVTTHINVVTAVKLTDRAKLALAN